MTKLQILLAQNFNFIKFQYLKHEIFCFSKIKNIYFLHVLYVNTKH